jgi:arginine exporter protein ArgO
MTILAFVGIFAGLGLVGGAGDDFAAAGVLVLGVFLGSACWWLILVIGVGAVRQRLAASALLWINRISGAIMMGFGVLALLPAAG